MENQFENEQVQPSNNMVWAILCTVCCCLPLGIVAIIKASSVSKLWAAGEYAAAEEAAAAAKKWALIGMAPGLIMWGTILLLVCCGGCAAVL